MIHIRTHAYFTIMELSLLVIAVVIFILNNIYDVVDFNSPQHLQESPK